MRSLSGVHRVPVEWVFESERERTDPFNEVSLDVAVTDPAGNEQLVPAYWTGGGAWKLRYAAHSAGRFTWRTVCSDPGGPGLHDQVGTLDITEYLGYNALYRLGAIRPAPDQRHFEHADGTPFLWFGDTWWFGLCTRLDWPDGFQALTADRVRKGFNVVQITTGLNPEATGGGTSPFDPRSFNEAGYPWEDGYARVNPAYWDLADARIQHLVDNGIVPCIVGSWGYHLPPMGVARMQDHWRYMIARWGALPVVWCLAGELTMCYWPPRTANELDELAAQGLTIADRRKRDSALQKSGYTEVARYVRATDPYRRMFTLHPEYMHSCLEQIEDPSLLDFQLLQTNHDDWWGTPASLGLLNDELAREPRMPVMIGEVAYEGLQQHNRQEVVRFGYWSAMLSGEAGHTYGAGGIFEMESSKEPYGRTPDGDWHSYLDEPWDVAAQFPGASQIGWAKALFERFEWWRLEPHPEWIEPHWSPERYRLPYAAYIPGELAMVYVPTLIRDRRDAVHQWASPRVSHLDPSARWTAFWFCPSTGHEEPIPAVEVAPDGTWVPPVPNEMVDWVLVVHRG